MRIFRFKKIGIFPIMADNPAKVANRKEYVILDMLVHLLYYMFNFEYHSEIRFKNIKIDHNNSGELYVLYELFFYLFNIGFLI